MLAGLVAAALAIVLGASLTSAPTASARESIASFTQVEGFHVDYCRHHRRRCAARRARLASTATATRVSPDFYGVNGQTFSRKFMPLSEWDTQLDGVRKAGFSSVRREAWWCDVERTAPSGGVHSYNWTDTDEFVAALARNNLRWYPMVSPGAGWAGTSWASPPTNAHIPDYAAFAGALAERYGTNGTFWQAHPELPSLPVRDLEIWNEPDLQRFWVDDLSGSPNRYGAMLAAATAAINDADPEARVVAGALAPAGAVDYIAEMVRAHPELRDQVSTFSFHPYGRTASRSLDRIVAIRRAVDQWLGRDVEIQITEDGLSLTPSSPYTLQDRADLWAKLALTLPRTDCRISGFLPHNWTGPKTDPTQHDEWYGMADWRTGELDPSGVALKRAILRMEGLGSNPPPTGKVSRLPKVALAAPWFRKGRSRPATVSLVVMALNDYPGPSIWDVSDICRMRIRPYSGLLASAFTAM